MDIITNSADLLQNVASSKRSPSKALIVVIFGVYFASHAADAQERITAQQERFFEEKIRPVLADKCYSCHSEESGENQGGLLLDSREGIRRGGDSGSAVVPGRLTASLLISAIRYTSDDLQMPPKDEGGRLSSRVVRDFETWIQMGAPDPRDGPAIVVSQYDTSDARSWWSFQPMDAATTPPERLTGEHASWPQTDIDRFVAAGWSEHNLSPVEDADPRVYLRRLRFDLTGLPPSVDEVEEFVVRWDASPRSREALIEETVDRLLESREYAERWGRRWLDVARFAESSGKDVNLVYPHAWRYRDYVIQSFDDDKPFDQFVREQIAGDLLPAKGASQQAEQLTATAFLALGENPINERNPKQFAVDLADDQIGTVTQAFLGMTVSCARCHDHRFDPISQRDYTALAGIFLSTETKYGTPGAVGGRNRAELIELPKAARLPVISKGITSSEARQKEQKLQRLQQQQRSARAQRANGGRATDGLTDFDLVRISTQVSQLEFELSMVNGDGSAKPLTMGVSDRPETAPATRRSRGPQQGMQIQPGPPSRQRPQMRRGQSMQGGPQMRRGPQQGSEQFRGPRGQRGPGQQGQGQQMGPRGRGPSSEGQRGAGPGRPMNNDSQPDQMQSGRRLRSSGFEQIGDSPLFLRGSIENVGDPVPRGVPALVGSGQDIQIRKGSGRLELADALVSDGNTLTARVIVNRVWYWMFGRGLIESVDNFGTSGATPSHPELLDYLATRFVENGWSIKQLIREITRSRVYRLASSYDEANFAADPSNEFLWQHTPRRLEAEELRDGILAAAGQLNLKPTAGSLIGRAGDGPIGGLRFQAVTLDQIGSADNKFRSIYLPATRSVEPEVLAAFDPPNTSVSDGTRDATNVPSQALFMLNSEFVADESRALAERALREHPGRSALSSFSQRLDFVFGTVLNRAPTETEFEAAKTLARTLGDSRTAWTSLVRGLFSSAEFRFID